MAAPHKEVLRRTAGVENSDTCCFILCAFPGGFRSPLLTMALFYNDWECKRYARKDDVDTFT